jgi:hypothetical protein
MALGSSPLPREQYSSLCIHGPRRYDAFGEALRKAYQPDLLFLWEKGKPLAISRDCAVLSHQIADK